LDAVVGAAIPTCNRTDYSYTLDPAYQPTHSRQLGAGSQ